MTVTRDGYQEVTVTVDFDSVGQVFTRNGELFDTDNGVIELIPFATFQISGQLESDLGELQDWPSRAFVTLFGDDNQTRYIEPVLPDGRFDFGQDLESSAVRHKPPASVPTLPFSSKRQHKLAP